MRFTPARSAASIARLFAFALIPCGAGAQDGAFTIEARTAYVAEGEDITFDLTRTGAAVAELVLDLTVRETGSTLTDDPPRRLTFPANSATAVLTVPTAGDDAHEEDSVVTVVIEPGLAAWTRVEDDDMAPPLPAGPALSRLSVATANAGIYPAFDPERSHYALRCTDDSRHIFNLAANEEATGLSVNGADFDYGSSGVQLEATGLRTNDDIVIEVRGGSDRRTYVLHCIPPLFPVIQVTTQPGAGEGLMMIQGDYHRAHGVTFSYIALIDDEGVPRFHMTSGTRSAALRHFRPLPSGPHPYAIGSADGHGVEWQILDASLQVVESGVTTVSPLTRTGLHDFLVGPNGNYILMAYEPAERDLSAFEDDDGEPYSTAEPTEDSAIQERTPGGTAVLTWNSWNHLAIEDCTQHRFPEDWAHVNSLALTPEGDLLASFRGCSQVALIDWRTNDGAPGTGELAWLLGKSNRSDWTAPRLAIEGDPLGEICGQHNASMLKNGNLLVFDNGGHCLADATTGNTERTDGVFSRAVEYSLDTANGTATFVRHVSLHNSFRHYAVAQGSVDALENGNWLISWGRGGAADDDATTGLPPDVAITEVDPDTGREVVAVKIQHGADPRQISSYRAYRVVVDPPVNPRPSLNATHPPPPPPQKIRRHRRRQHSRRRHSRRRHSRRRHSRRRRTRRTRRTRNPTPAR